MTGSISETLFANPLLMLLLIGVGLIVLAGAALVLRWRYRSRKRRVRKDNYFNDEFADSIIPSRKRIKRKVTRVFPLMVAQNPDWKSHSGLGEWQIEPSLAAQFDSDPLLEAIVYALFFDASAYDRQFRDPTFSYQSMRGFISEAMFLYRREFDLFQVDVAVKEWQAREAASQEQNQGASVSRWATS